MPRKCKECGTEMDKFSSLTNKKDYMYECPNCDNIILSAILREIEKSRKDMIEGRAYILCCGIGNNGKCNRSGQPPTICYRHCTEESKRWYRLGKKDERLGTSVNERMHRIKITYKKKNVFTFGDISIALKDMRCISVRGKCKESGDKISICQYCAIKQIFTWYNLGRKDVQEKMEKARSYCCPKLTRLERP